MASFWRKEDPIVGDRGNIITGGMFDHQRDWWQLDNFIKALIAGYGSGKTFIGCKRGISMALQNAPAPHLIISPSYKMAKRTVIPTMKALLDGKKHLTRTLRWKFNKSDFEFTIYYKGRRATIWLASGDNPESLKGPNVGSAHVDEPFLQEEEVLKQTLARVRDPDAVISEILLTGTPESLNWGYDICEGDKVGLYDVGIIHANTRQNKSLGEQYANRMEAAYTDRAVEAFVEGKFVNLQTGTVYYAFSNANIQEIEDPGGELGVGMDFNVNPMAATVFWTKGDHIHFMDEIELPNSDTDYMCGHIKDTYIYKEGDRKGQCRVEEICPDATGRGRSTNAPGGKSDFYYIKKNGFHINVAPTNPRRRDRENAVNGKLNSRGGGITMTISPKCKRLIGYLRKYNHEEINKQKGMSHLIDSMGYPVHRIYGVERIQLLTSLSGH